MSQAPREFAVRVPVAWFVVLVLVLEVEGYVFARLALFALAVEGTRPVLLEGIKPGLVACGLMLLATLVGLVWLFLAGRNKVVLSEEGLEARAWTGKRSSLQWTAVERLELWRAAGIGQQFTLVAAERRLELPLWLETPEELLEAMCRLAGFEAMATEGGLRRFERPGRSGEESATAQEEVT